MPTLEATAEVTGTEIMHFGDWFMGGSATFGMLAAQVGLAFINLTVLLWVAK